jgi:predicted RNA-binding protein with PIN domain
LEFAVRSAEGWQREKPPQPVPPEIKAFFKQPRLPARVLGRIRRIVEADEEFRLRLAAAADAIHVDELGVEWLRREPGWEQRVADLIVAGEQDRADRAAERVLAHERRRREAAEQRAVKSNAELVSVRDRLAVREKELGALRRQQADVAADIEGLRRSVSDAKREARHANDRAEAARRSLEQMTTERDEAVRRAAAAERQRDELLAARAQLPPESGGAARIAHLRDLAAAAQALAGELESMVAVGPRRRWPIDVPPEAGKDPRRAAEFLLRTLGVVVLVDGYNVAMLGWPELSLEDQRGRLLDAVDGLARRFGTEFVVVIDGADVVGAHTDRRRLARVRYSPAGVTADDVIREEVAGLDLARHVVVVTNDAEIRRDVLAAGSNVVKSDVFVDLARR